MRERLARALYSALMWLAQPLLRRKLRRRARAEPGYALAIDERWGHYATPPEHRGELLWVHAVSLGETRAAAIVLKAWRSRHPQTRLLLTHGTATGREAGQALLQAGDVQVWQPWDTPAAVARFLDHFRPRLGVLMETEIWPNLIHACQVRGIALVLANARLNARSLAGAQRWPSLMMPAYRGLTAALAQTDGDAARLRQLGASVAAVTGNLKFDATPASAQVAAGAACREAMATSVVLLASSREGEEVQFFKEITALSLYTSAFDAMKNDDFHAPVVPCFLVVPRHPQRFDAVADLALAAGFAVVRRSAFADMASALLAWREKIGHRSQPVLLLGDSLGEMALYYSLADVALLGGSFEPLGGQNLIEAAACGCPVVMGPSTFNFDEAAQWAQAAGAAQRVADMHEGLQQALAHGGPGGLTLHARSSGAGVCPAPVARTDSVRDRCARFAATHRGAAARQVAVLELIWAQGNP